MKAQCVFEEMVDKTEGYVQQVIGDLWKLCNNIQNIENVTVTWEDDLQLEATGIHSKSGLGDFKELGKHM